MKIPENIANPSPIKLSLETPILEKARGGVQIVYTEDFKCLFVPKFKKS